MKPAHLFSITFTRPGDNYLSRHYNTYVIYSTGVSGSYQGPRDEVGSSCWYRRSYKILWEFADIADQLYRLDFFDQFEPMWYDALQAALEQARKEDGVDREMDWMFRSMLLRSLKWTGADQIIEGQGV